jgi:hypothetical protein
LSVWIHRPNRYWLIRREWVGVAQTRVTRPGNRFLSLFLQRLLARSPDSRAMQDPAVAEAPGGASRIQRQDEHRIRDTRSAGAFPHHQAGKSNRG